jgi:NifU-like protein involved in Fe-S cluster formation
VGYSEVVERYFRQPPPVFAGECAGQAGSVATGTWVGLRATVREGRVQNLGFRAYACPHIIAVCHWLGEQLEGQSLDVLSSIDRNQLEQLFDIPAEKAGKLLILQDAFTNLLVHAQAKATTGES